MPTGILGSLIDLAYGEIGYNRSMRNQARLFEREDNAIQRRVADLNRAGLNPLLGISPASSSLGSIHVGNSDFKSSMGELTDYLKNDYKAIKEHQKMQVENSKSDLALKEKQKGLLDLQQQEAEQKVLNLIANTESINQKTREDAYNLKYYENLGLPTNSSSFMKSATAIPGTILTKNEQTKGTREQIKEKKQLVKTKKAEVKALEKQNKELKKIKRKLERQKAKEEKTKAKKEKPIIYNNFMGGKTR